MSIHSIPVQALQVGFGSQNGTALITPLSGKQIKVYAMSLTNRSGSTSDLAILKGIAPSQFKVFTYNGSAATNVTTTIQAGSSITVATTSSGSGIIVQAKKRFGFIALNVNSAGTGTPTITVKYWNGSAFVNATAINVASSFASGNDIFYVTQEFLQGLGANAFDAALDSTMYTLQISVASSSNSPTANSIVVASTVEFAPQVSNNTTFNSAYSEDYPLFLDANEKVIPYFQTVSASNMISTFYAQDN